ncbi:MAG TPA: hypothetical protein PKL13_04750 [bacterium]|nr:hypothetical protein [bacterium]
MFPQATPKITPDVIRDQIADKLDILIKSNERNDKKTNVIIFLTLITVIFTVLLFIFSF